MTLSKIDEAKEVKKENVKVLRKERKRLKTLKRQSKKLNY